MNRAPLTRVAADTSSLILLQKVDLLHSFLASYVPVIAASVYKELDVPGKRGAGQLSVLLRQAVRGEGDGDEVAGLGKGESGAILLWKKGLADFLLVDDKKAARYCRSHAIPFINCLLVPRILEKAGVLTAEQRTASFSLLLRCGYYSPKIIRRAAAISDGLLLAFRPQWSEINPSACS